MDDLKYEMEEEARCGTRIKVVGVGGGGSNAVARMVQEGMEGVEFYAMNTDTQALAACQVPNKLQLGGKVTNGLGAGSNPEIGRQAALENTDPIVEALQGADMVFVIAGLGGGTGTGAAPVIASLAKELDALTIAVVTKPFGFEGPHRMRLAEEGIARLAATVDAVIPMPNDRLLKLVPRGTSFFDAFKFADDLVRQVVQSISDIIVTPGLINRDFSDIKATMAGMGYAMMGTATARGENAVVEAARQAISCPLLEDTRIAGSRAILINITGSPAGLGLHEVNEACSLIREAAECDDVQINFGVILNEAMGGCGQDHGHRHRLPARNPARGGTSCRQRHARHPAECAAAGAGEPVAAPPNRRRWRPSSRNPSRPWNRNRRSKPSRCWIWTTWIPRRICARAGC